MAVPRDIVSDTGKLASSKKQNAWVDDAPASNSAKSEVQAVSAFPRIPRQIKRRECQVQYSVLVPCLTERRVFMTISPPEREVKA
ncbi:hypothetical protein, partial [Microcoleus sp. K4-C2]|uniref:hypothetical protein n=1 Tax=Microcoleus sp. K4-C2 TaxID=2818792 RepID=UPI002FD11700